MERDESEAGEILSTWLEFVDRVPPEQYVAIGEVAALPHSVYADSYRWSNAFLRPEIHPYLETLRVKRSVHLATEDTLDLLRHEYETGLEIVESRMFSVMRVRHRGDLRMEIVRAATSVLKLPADFRYPEVLEEGATFSTNPTQHPMVLDWPERMDGGIRNGRLWFLCYKRSQGVLGYRDPKAWFDDEFRARWRR